MTLPNQITLGRTLAIPVAVVLLCSHQPDLFGIGYILAFLVAVGDFVDGYLARRLKQESLFGKILDPIGDKLLVLLLLLMFVDWGMLPAWAFVLILLREIVISDFRTLAMLRGREVAVSKGGKWKATVQYLLLAALGAERWLALHGVPPEEFRQGSLWALVWLGKFLLAVTLILTLASLFEYFWTNRAVFSGKPLRRKVS